MEFQVELTIAPLYDDRKERRGLVVVFHDITEAKRLQEQLKSKLLEISVIFRNAGVGIGFMRNGIIREVNSICEEIFGLPQAAIIGQPATLFLFSELKYPHPVDDIYATLTRGERVDIEHQFVRRDGKKVWFRIIGHAVDPERLEDRGSVWIAQDVTKNMKYQELLQVSREMAEEANRFKSEFLAYISHEIRNPMNGIIGMNRLVLETDLRPQQRKYLSLMQSSAENLFLMLNNLLDLSKIEEGIIELEEKPFGLHLFFEKVRDITAFKCEEKGLDISFEIAPDVHTSLIGDEFRLGQILFNLIGNAVKFTTKGGITVSCRGLSQNDHDVFLQFRVADTGIGISKSAQAHIFEPYVQSASSVARLFGGTGLGLSICKKITEMFAGDIRLESEAGKGATFSFTARFKKNYGPDSGQHELSGDEEAVPKPLPELKILLVEDEPINQALMKTVLTRAKHHVRVAGNGQEAVNALAQFDFDLILMDVEMPGMDRLTATSLIRRCEKEEQLHAGEEEELLQIVAERLSGKHLPIVAITANATTRDREQCIAAGMDAYISKPFEEDDMVKALRSLLISDD